MVLLKEIIENKEGIVCGQELITLLFIEYC